MQARGELPRLAFQAFVFLFIAYAPTPTLGRGRFPTWGFSAKTEPAAAAAPTIVGEIVALKNIGFQRFGHKCGGADTSTLTTTMLIPSVTDAGIEKGGRLQWRRAKRGSEVVGNTSSVVAKPGSSPTSEPLTMSPENFLQVGLTEANATGNGISDIAISTENSGDVEWEQNARVSATESPTPAPAPPANGVVMVLPDSEDEPSLFTTTGSSLGLSGPIFDVSVRNSDSDVLELRDEQDVEGLTQARYILTRSRDEVDPGFITRHRAGLVIILGAAVVSSVASLCVLLVGFYILGGGGCTSSVRSGATTDGGESSTEASVSGVDGKAVAVGTSVAQCDDHPSNFALRARVKALEVCSAAEVERCLPLAGGYDCAFSRPVSSRVCLRVEGVVEAAQFGTVLKAPLTQQACVVYSATASRQIHDGMPPIPVSFSSASTPFIVAVVDGGARVQLELSGDDVSLFDVRGGRHVARRSFARAPDHWQDFVLTHRAASPGTELQTSSALHADTNALEFQECALLVGSVVTLVGELHRSADGTLSLRPEQSNNDGPDPASMGWRTSWERTGCEAAEEAGRIDKVLVSDDPALLSSNSRSACLLATCPIQEQTLVQTLPGEGAAAGVRSSPVDWLLAPLHAASVGLLRPRPSAAGVAMRNDSRDHQA
eukprot:TRINITY_DN43335_c0_g1_i1.p1 TRINITY_DN43335_c0_g1~~TRINITY_DN43335_c0_g1_i1.p1  ORF type:complete len:658 (+),score=87.99 TRINITY_DN43335_c0_g1_i1:113-2086(+)